jgi:hypothetical protein
MEIRQQPVHGMYFLKAITPIVTVKYGPGERSRYSDLLWAGRSGDPDPLEAKFLTTVKPTQEPTQPPIQWVQGLFLGVKRPERGVDHPPPSSADVKERVEVYLHFPCMPSWPVFVWVTIK